jgi:hypothetical protein
LNPLKLIEKPEDELFAPIKYLFHKLRIGDSITNRDEIGKIWKSSEDVFVSLKNRKKEISLRDCTKVEIHYEGYMGEFLFQIVRPRWRVLLGDRNKLKLKIKNESHDFYVLLTNRNDRNSLKMMLEFCYDNSIQVKEYYRGKRTFKWEK